MAKNNFDDFLLDPSFDDLDSVHLEAQRQLYKNGGLFKRKKKKKNKNKVSDEQAAQIDKVANTNPKGGQSTVQTNSPKKRSTSIEVKKKAPVSHAKPLTVKKTIKKVATKRGTGNTYKSTWEANKDGVQKKYKSYGEFETAAKAWNKKNDAKKAKAKPQSKATKVGNKLVSATEKKKLLSKSVWDKIPQGNKM